MSNLNMNDFVTLRGVGDYIPGGALASRPLSSITSRQQMFGMGDYIPGNVLASRPTSSIYNRQQMFGMGQDDLTASIAQAQAELMKTKAERSEAQSRLQELKAAGATVLRDVTGAVTAHPVAAGMSAGTVALLAGGAYLLAKQMKWIK